jgi:hypothetical protein
MTITKEEMLQFILEIARKARVKVAIGGGIAVNSHGYRRDTADVDAFFHLPDQHKVLRQLNDQLGDNFVLEEFDPSHWIVAAVGASPDERINLLFAAGDPEESAIEMATTKKYHGIETPVFPIDMLVISKFLAERDDAKDSLDIYELHRKGAFEISSISTRLRQMGFDEDAQRFPEFMAYLQGLSAKKKG